MIITKEGKKLLVKNNNGVKLEILNGYLFSDINNKVRDLFINNEIDIDLDFIKENATIIFNKDSNIIYTQLGGNWVYDTEKYDTKFNEILTSTKSNTLEKETDFSIYSLKTQKSKYNLNGGESYSFDGIIYTAKPYNDYTDKVLYKQDYKNFKKLDHQKVIIFAIQYFTNNKITISNQSIEGIDISYDLKINISPDKEDITENDIVFQSKLINTYDDIADGLHIVNDGTTNLENNIGKFGGEVNLLLGDYYDETSLETFNTIGKLNILNDAESYTPQMSITTTRRNNVDNIPIWGDTTLDMYYGNVSGSDTTEFYIRETPTKPYDESDYLGLNFDLMGSNNTYGIVSYENVFVVSHDNTIGNNAQRNFFLNSHYNTYKIHDSFQNFHDISHINSNNNVFETSGGEFRDISFYNSHKNYFTKGGTGQIAYVQGFSMYNSNRNLLVDSQTHYTKSFFNTHDSMYEKTNNSENMYTNSFVSIGGSYNYVYNNADFNGMTLIGTGLISKYSPYRNQLIVGQFNKDTVNSRDLVFAIGNGIGDINDIRYTAASKGFIDYDNKKRGDDYIYNFIGGDDDEFGVTRSNIFEIKGDDPSIKLYSSTTEVGIHTYGIYFISNNEQKLIYYDALYHLADPIRRTKDVIPTFIDYVTSAQTLDLNSSSDILSTPDIDGNIPVSQAIQESQSEHIFLNVIYRTSGSENLTLNNEYILNYTIKTETYTLEPNTMKQFMYSSSGSFFSGFIAVD